MNGEKSRKILKRMFFDPIVPRSISSNFINRSSEKLNIIQNSLLRNFFSQSPQGYLNTDIGKSDLEDHVFRRLENNRRYVIPWLNNSVNLLNTRVLELGCGTGSSTLALAEQGCRVTAVDIDDKALIDAKKRCEIYGVKADFYQANVTEVGTLFPGKKFDLIIFWACLEHLTHEERMLAMEQTWHMLPKDGLWCITDTPNRLWFYDFHTSLLPFFFWLPDELAIKYTHFSPRQRFRESFIDSKGQDEDKINLSRWGRGVSYHEFELTMKPLDELDIVSCMSLFNRQQRLLANFKFRISSSFRFESLLIKLHPKLHPGFCQENLDLIIRKS